MTVFGATGFLGRYIVNRLGMKLLGFRELRPDCENSKERMYGYSTFPRGDGEKALEDCG